MLRISGWGARTPASSVADCNLASSRHWILFSSDDLPQAKQGFLSSKSHSTSCHPTVLASQVACITVESQLSRHLIYRNYLKFICLGVFRSPGHPAVWSQQGRGLGPHKQGTSNILSSIFVDPDP